MGMTKLSFQIQKDLNPERLLFVDTSEYTSSPVSPTLHIKFPDLTKIYTTPIQHSELNILNTARIGLTDCITKFPDGPYCFNFEVDNKRCEVDQKEYITTQARKKLSILLDNIDYSNSTLLDKVVKIWIYLHGAESKVKSDQKTAQELYKQALKLIDCELRMYEQSGKCSGCSK